MTYEEAQRLAREKGVSGPLYAVVRGTVTPFVRVWFRMRVSGSEHVPREGAAILAPNHKSFYDSFFIGVAVKRHLRFMAKVELFEGPKGRLLARLGAFPVRRGHSDADALETARSVLEQGGLLAIFPEGTRVRDPVSLGEPRRGVGRLALESGAPLVPVAITGSDHLWAGPLPKPKRIQVTFGPPIPVAAMASNQDEAGKLVEEVLWPEVESEFRRLRARPGLIAAALTALGVGGGLALQRRGARRHARLDPRRLARRRSSLGKRAKKLGRKLG